MRKRIKQLQKGEHPSALFLATNPTQNPKELLTDIKQNKQQILQGVKGEFSEEMINETLTKALIEKESDLVQAIANKWNSEQYFLGIFKDLARNDGTESLLKHLNFIIEIIKNDSNNTQDSETIFSNEAKLKNSLFHLAMELPKETLASIFPTTKIILTLDDFQNFISQYSYDFNFTQKNNKLNKYISLLTSQNNLALLLNESQINHDEYLAKTELALKNYHYQYYKEINNFEYKEYILGILKLDFNKEKLINFLRYDLIFFEFQRITLKTIDGKEFSCPITAEPSFSSGLDLHLKIDNTHISIKDISDITRIYKDPLINDHLYLYDNFIRDYLPVTRIKNAIERSQTNPKSAIFLLLLSGFSPDVAEELDITRLLQQDHHFWSQITSDLGKKIVNDEKLIYNLLQNRSNFYNFRQAAQEILEREVNIELRNNCYINKNQFTLKLFDDLEFEFTLKAMTFAKQKFLCISGENDLFQINQLQLDNKILKQISLYHKTLDNLLSSPKLPELPRENKDSNKNSDIELEKIVALVPYQKAHQEYYH